MYSYQTEGIYITSMLDTRRANSDEKYPVKIRVTHKRQRSYFSTGKYFNEKEWNGLPSAKNREKQEDRKDIQMTFDNVKAEILKLVSDGEFSFEGLNRRLSKAASTDIVNTAFALKIDTLRKAGQIGTAIVYECTLSSIEKFAGSSITFQNINVEWLKKYERTLIEQGKSHTTVGMYARCIRAILNEGIESGILKQAHYPFSKKKDEKGKFSIKTGQGRKLALTKEQVDSIANYSDGLMRTELYRDLWYFSYLCNGANFTDILKLKDSNIKNGEICFIRQKTSRTSKEVKLIKAKIQPAMQNILDKWRIFNKRRKDEYLFDFLTGKETPEQEKARIQDIVRRTNRKLSKIGEALGIEGLNTYTARHSFTNISLRGGAPVAYIAEQLGHANIKTTQGYISGFNTEEREKYSGLL